MVSDFINESIFWEYDISGLDPDRWSAFIIKQVFNRNVGCLPKAIPSLIEYYGREPVEVALRAEEWLTSEGIQTARRFFPHLEKRDFRATARINRRRRILAKAGEFYGHL